MDKESGGAKRCFVPLLIHEGKIVLRDNQEPQIFKVKVKKIVKSGVFVRLPDETEGFIYKRDLSWNCYDQISDIVSERQYIEAVKIGLDEERNLTILSVKHLKDEPWREVVKEIESFVEESQKEFGMNVWRISMKGY